MIGTAKTYRQRTSEDGYVLVAVIFMMVILILSLAVAVPKVREDIQRDRDEETMQRGKQYIRAIQLYFRKFHAYPPNVDALVKTNDIRFLRKKYIDPTTGKDEWKPIMWGQNKTPMVMGFFGQPLAAGVGGGIGPSGNNTGLNGTGLNGAVPGQAGATSPPSGGLFSSSSFGSTTDSGAASSGAAGAAQTGTTGTDANGNPTSGSTATPGSTGSTFGSNNPTGNGQTFGGAGIIGFSPQSPKQSIYVYKKKNHYNEWEFLYSPQMDQQQMTGGNTGIVGQPAGGTSTPVGGSTFGTTPTTPTAPTTPTSPQQ